MLNELLLIIVMLVSFGIVLFSAKLGKKWLIAVPAALLIIANIFAPQFISAFGIITSLALPIYAAIFLATDIIAEHWGKKEARKVVWIGLLTQIALVVFSQIAIRANVISVSTEVHAALNIIFSFTPRIVLGSFVAYLVSQNWDIFIFHLLKQKTRSKHLWLRNNVSTITSQLIDSTLFILIAFYGVMPGIIFLILGIWILKVGVALLDTPIMYLSYKFIRK